MYIKDFSNLMECRWQETLIGQVSAGIRCNDRLANPRANRKQACVISLNIAVPHRKKLKNHSQLFLRTKSVWNFNKSLIYLVRLSFKTMNVFSYQVSSVDNGNLGQLFSVLNQASQPAGTIWLPHHRNFCQHSTVKGQ